MDRRLLAAILGSVGTLVSFRLRVQDSDLLAPEFGLTNDDDPLPELRPFTAYVRTPERTWTLDMPDLTGHHKRPARRWGGVRG
jgi:hypothetical protein